MADSQQAEEAEIQVGVRTARNTPSGKKVWDIVAADGTKFSCWSDTLAGLMTPAAKVGIKFTSTVSGKYTNRTIHEVKPEGGTWQKDAASAGKGGYAAKGANFDPSLSKKQTCINAAASVVAHTYGVSPEDAAYDPQAIGEAVVSVARKLETFFADVAKPVAAKELVAS